MDIEKYTVEGRSIMVPRNRTIGLKKIVNMV